MLAQGNKLELERGTGPECPITGISAFRHGARAGAVAFLIYWIVEFSLCSIVSWFLTPHYEYRPINRGFMALMLVIYPAIGFLAGGCCGWVLGWLSARSRCRFSLPDAAASAALLVVLNGILIVSAPRSLWMALSAALSTPLLVLLLWCYAGSRPSRLRALVSPWAIALFLTGAEYITADFLAGASFLSRLAGLIFTLIAVVAMLLTMHSLAGKWSNRTRRITLGAMTFAVLGLALVIDQSPIDRGIKSPAAGQGTAHPNVILITLDTVRADHLSIYGYAHDTTPNLRKLASESTLYTRAIASSDMTLSTHGSLLTGMYASSHGAHYVPGTSYYARLPKESRTMAEMLSEHGYATMAVVANYGFLHASYGFDKGFQYYDQRVSVPFAGGARPFYLRTAVQWVIAHFYSTPTYEREARNGGEVNRDVFPLLEEVSNHRNRFFLFVNYMDAHTPYVPPAPFDTLYPGKVPRFTVERLDAIKLDVMGYEHQIAPAERAHMVSQYDGGIAYLDSQLGRLVERLKQLGLFDNTLLVITSDHGETFGEKKLVGHEVGVYQSLVHVPLLIKYPHQNRGATSNELVSSVDIMPTVLDEVGYPIPRTLQGRSLTKPAPGDSIAVFSESFATPFLSQSFARFRRVERTILSDEFKYIESSAGKRELYDLAADPAENHNLYDGGAVSRNLAARLNAWQRSVLRQGAQQKAPDRNTLERLRSLGYVQ